MVFVMFLSYSRFIYSSSTSLSYPTCKDILMLSIFCTAPVSLLLKYAKLYKDWVHRFGTNSLTHEPFREHFVAIWVNYFIAMTECLTKQKGCYVSFFFSWLIVWRDTVHHGWEGMTAGTWGSWSHHNHSQEAERDECWGSAHFLKFSPGPQVMGWHCPHSGWVFPPWLFQSRNPSLTAQKFFSTLNINAIKLTIKISSHSIQTSIPPWGLCPPICNARCGK